MSKPTLDTDEKLVDEIQKCFFDALEQHLPEQTSSKLVLVLLDKMRAEMFLKMCNAKPERAKEIAQMIVTANLNWNPRFIQMAQDISQPNKPEVLH